MSFKQAGCRRVVPDVGGEIFRGWLPAILRRFSTPEARHQKRIRIVDSCGDVFSDPGANPGASTIRLAARVKRGSLMAGRVIERVTSNGALSEARKRRVEGQAYSLKTPHSPNGYRSFFQYARLLESQ